MESDKKVVPFFNESREQLITRFFSILLTAIISALITFLQSLVIEPATGVPAHEQATQAGALGAVLRAGLEFAKVSRHA